MNISVMLRYVMVSLALCVGLRGDITFDDATAPEDFDINVSLRLADHDTVDAATSNDEHAAIIYAEPVEQQEETQEDDRDAQEESQDYEDATEEVDSQASEDATEYLDSQTLEDIEEYSQEADEASPVEEQQEEVAETSQDEDQYEAAPQETVSIEGQTEATSSNDEFDLEEIEFPIDPDIFPEPKPVSTWERASWYAFIAGTLLADGVVRAWSRVKDVGSAVRQEFTDVMDYIRSEYTHAHRYLRLHDKRFAMLRAIGRTVWEVGVADVVGAIRYESFSNKEWSTLLGVIGANVAQSEYRAWKRHQSASHVQEAAVGALALYLALIRHNAQEDKKYRVNDYVQLSISEDELRELVRRVFSAPDEAATNFRPDQFAVGE